MPGTLEERANKTTVESHNGKTPKRSISPTRLAVREGGGGRSQQQQTAGSVELHNITPSPL